MLAWLCLVAVVGGDTETYRRQLEQNPALANDPAFRAAFEKAYNTREQPLPEVKKEDAGVRSHRMLGAVLTFGAQDVVAIGATVFFWQHLQLTASFGTFTPSFSFDVRWVWFKWAFSPYLGVGIHVPFARGFLTAPWADLWKATFLWAEVGGQWVSNFGLYAQVGVQLVPQLDSTPGRLDWPRLLPTVAVGWLADL